MHWLLRLKKALKATIQNAAFESVSKNGHVVLAIKAIEGEFFWKGMVCLLRIVFPALKALRYCCSNVPSVAKINFLVRRADAAIDNSSSLLNNEELFCSPDNCVITLCEEKLDDFFRRADL